MFAQFVTHAVRIGSFTKLGKAFYSKSQFLQHEVSEIEIPVPWGKVAGKLWGSQDKQPVLAMHGWQDNAASFDNLAPLIAKHTPVLAIDLPGHGLSSWLPPGFLYTELVYFLLVKRIQKHFRWEKVKVIVHSLSAMVMYWYAATFPMEVQYVIALDFFKFPSVDASIHATIFGNAVDTFFKLEESNNAQPRYTQNDIIKKGLTGYTSLGLRNPVPFLDESAYKILMTRGVTRTEDGMYIFNRDPRLRIMPVHSMFSQEQLEEYATLITCPYLIIKGDLNLYVEKKEYFYRTLEILKANNDKVYFETLPATHHFHLTHAEAAATIINPFLEKYD